MTHASAGETLAEFKRLLKDYGNGCILAMSARHHIVSTDFDAREKSVIDAFLAQATAQPAQADATRRETIEECANVCDDVVFDCRGPEAKNIRYGAQQCADRIRAVAQPAQADATRRIVEEIAAERERQKSIEGYTLEHDDRHNEGEIAMGALAYAAPDWFFEWLAKNDIRLWQWDEPIKRTGGIRLIKAAAMIVAEIERQRRALAGAPGEKGEG